MVNLFNATVAIIRLVLAFIMLFIGIILLINNPKLNGIVGTIPLSVYIGILLTIAAFVLGVISIESKPIPGPPGPKGDPGPDQKCVCEHCSNFKYYEVPTDVISEEISKPEGPQLTTLKDM